MVIAVPIGLFSAIYLAEYAHPKFRAWTKPFLEVLAGVPDGGVRILRRADRRARRCARGARRSAWTSPPRARWPPGSSWAS